MDAATAGQVTFTARLRRHQTEVAGVDATIFVEQAVVLELVGEQQGRVVVQQLRQQPRYLFDGDVADPLQYL